MSTRNPRINVTLEKMTVESLAILAKNEQKSLSGLVRDLVTEALEIREDYYLSKLVEATDNDDQEKYSHEEAWK
jgi:predicted DNA-binding protein